MAGLWGLALWRLAQRRKLSASTTSTTTPREHRATTRSRRVDAAADQLERAEPSASWRRPGGARRLRLREEARDPGFSHSSFDNGTWPCRTTRLSRRLDAAATGQLGRLLLRPHGLAPRRELGQFDHGLLRGLRLKAGRFPVAAPSDSAVASCTSIELSRRVTRASASGPSTSAVTLAMPRPGRINSW